MGTAGRTAQAPTREVKDRKILGDAHLPTGGENQANTWVLLIMGSPGVALACRLRARWPALLLNYGRSDAVVASGGLPKAEVEVAM
jgi:hypothetical protein